MKRMDKARGWRLEAKDRRHTKGKNMEPPTYCLYPLT
jgi:hypothetical protein